VILLACILPILSALITQAPLPPASGGNIRDNEFSQVNAYDALDRLVKTDVGAIDTQTTPFAVPPAGKVRSDAWGLDLLGNWVDPASGGGAALPPAMAAPPAGRETREFDGGAEIAYLGLTHSTDARNRIGS